MIPQMEVSINGAISKMTKQALLDEAIGASFPIHHNLGLCEKLIAHIVTQFWNCAFASSLEGTVI